MRDPSAMYPILILPLSNAYTFEDNDQVLGNLIELFTNMDLAQLATIIDSNAIPSLGFANLTGTVSLGDASTGVFYLTPPIPLPS